MYLLPATAAGMNACALTTVSNFVESQLLFITICSSRGNYVNDKNDFVLLIHRELLPFQFSLM